jgi:prepilin-type N-terminal cleavage/methylation domain-containing protein
MLKCLNVKMKNKGFTLLEVIVAISILSLGVAGALTLIQRTVAFTSLTISRVVAAYLLQEGIEIVKNIRDGNWIEREAWDEGIKNGNWEIDYKTKNLNQTYLGRYLNIDNDGFYSYSAGTPTKFKRKITISKPSPDIIEVFVEVQWEERGRIHSLSGQENLYNWYSP